MDWTVNNKMSLCDRGKEKTRYASVFILLKNKVFVKLMSKNKYIYYKFYLINFINVQFGFIQ